MLRYLWHLPLDILEWVIFNLYLLSDGRFKWLNSLVVWMDLMSDETVEIIFDLDDDLSDDE